MDPNRVGRLLGIGTRVAAGKLRDGTAGAAAAVERGKAARSASDGSSAGSETAAGSGPRAESGAGRNAGAAREAVRSAAALAEGSHRFARGAGRFGAAIWKPFAHATGVLGLQITGLLFAFFALGFGAKCWQLYKDAGWQDHHLPLYLGFAALFLWFALSSFWRARRKQRRG